MLGVTITMLIAQAILGDETSSAAPIRNTIVAI